MRETVDGVARRLVSTVAAGNRFRVTARWFSHRGWLPFAVSRRLPVVGPVTIPLPDKQTVAYVSIADDSIKRAVFWQGWNGYEGETFSYLASTIASFDLLVDVGANTGYLAIVAAKLNPRLKVIAVEAAPSTFSYLCQNVEANGLTDRVRCVNVAAGAESGRAAFGLAEFDGVVAVESALLRVGNKQAAFSNVIDVNVNRLDDIITEDLSNVAVLLKIDVEGFEPEVLRGAERLLVSVHPTVLFELLPGGPRQELLALFDRVVYDLYRITEDGPVPDDDLKTVGGGIAERNYVAMPRRAA